MNYSLSELSKEELENNLTSNDIKIVTDTMLYITFNVDDTEWVQSILLRMLASKEDDVSGLAITCFGHLARIHSKIDKDRVIPKLLEKAKDHNFSSRVDDALEDIEMFAK